MLYSDINQRTWLKRRQCAYLMYPLHFQHVMWKQTPIHLQIEPISLIQTLGVRVHISRVSAVLGLWCEIIGPQLCDRRSPRSHWLGAAPSPDAQSHPACLSVKSEHETSHVAVRFVGGCPARIETSTFKSSLSMCETERQTSHSFHTCHKFIVIEMKHILKLANKCNVLEHESGNTLFGFHFGACFSRYRQINTNLL